MSPIPPSAPSSVPAAPATSLMVHRLDVSPVVVALARGVFDAGRAGWTDPGWWDADVRPEVEALMALSPGGGLLAALASLDSGGVAAEAGSAASGVCAHPHPGLWPGTPCACQVVVAAAWQAQVAWTELAADRHLVAVLGAVSRHVPVNPQDPVGTGFTDPGVEEVAPGLRCSPGSVRNRLARARRVCALPALTAAVEQGRVTHWQALLLVSDLAGFGDEVVDQVIDQVLVRLTDRQISRRRCWTITEVRRHARAVAARLDDRTGRQARDHARRRRGVRLRTTGPGGAQVIADLSEDDAARIMHRLTAIARGLLADAGDHTRSLEQIRADVFTDLLLTTSSADKAHGEAGEVAVVVGLDVILTGRGDAALPDGTLIDSAVARQLAADRRWRLWLTDPRHRVVATSATTYRPTAALARLIRARDRVCCYPGCQVPAAACDLDHVIPFPRGATEVANLQALCRRHHRFKTHTGWYPSTNTDTTGWRSPTGITYRD